MENLSTESQALKGLARYGRLWHAEFPQLSIIIWNSNEYEYLMNLYPQY